MTKIGYIEAKINDLDTIFFHELVKKICNPEDLYKSDVIHYINGDVTKKLHLTMFYGCNATGTKLNLLKEYIRNIELDELSLGQLFLLPGYQNLYQVLCVKVINTNNRLKKIFNDIRSFGYDQKNTTTKFIPHLTLAYVTKNYKLPAKTTIIKSVKIKSIDYLYD